MIETRESKALTWVATIWSVASIVFVLTFIFGEAFGGHAARPTGTEWVGLALWPGGVMVGLVIAWVRKGTGGTIAIASLVVFYFWHLLERGKFPGGPFFILVAAPGILFLWSSLLSRPRHQMRSV